jgi:polyhydroxyalkanoate synthase
VPVPGLLGLVNAAVSPFRRRAAVAKAAVSLSSELWRVGLGRSELTPNQRDRRFQDPIWATNPMYGRWAQSYPAVCGAEDSLLTEMARSVRWSDAEHARFALGILTSALAPTNTLLGNPSAGKKPSRPVARTFVTAWQPGTDVRHN